tara:strand:+ start:289 stop:462 length:174 start_codon:yes stop_codon:yes gene_type:complete
MYYRVIVMDHRDLDVEHYCELDTESADILRDALEQHYPVVGVLPITKKQYRMGVSEI